MSVARRKPSREIRARLASNMKRFRQQQDCTQKELAARCRLKTAYVSNVEQARVNITLANLETLAKGLRCSEEALLARGAQ